MARKPTRQLLSLQDKNELISVEAYQEILPINEDAVFSLIETELDELSKIMELLTDGKTTEFDAQVMLDALNPQTLLKGVEKECLPLVKLCLVAGISPDGMATDYEGKTNNLLAKAIRQKNMEMVDLLLEYGANPNGNENFRSVGHPLFAAVETENLDMAIKLLERGARSDVVIYVDSKVKLMDTTHFDSVFFSGERNCVISNFTSPLKRAIEMYYDFKKNEKSEISVFIPEMSYKNAIFIHQVDPSVMLLGTSDENGHVFSTGDVGTTDIVLAQETDNQTYIPKSLVFQNVVNLFNQQPVKNISDITKMIYLLIMANSECLDNIQIQEIIDAQKDYSGDSYLAEYTEGFLKKQYEQSLKRRFNCLKDNEIYLSSAIHKRYHSFMAMATEKGDLDMVRFLRIRGAKFRDLSKEQRLPIVDIDFKMDWRDRIDGNKFFHKDLSVNDEIISAVRSKNAKLLEYLINQSAPIKYDLKYDLSYEELEEKRINNMQVEDYSKRHVTGIRGITEAIRNDDVNMVAILMHHGVQLTDYVFFCPTNSYKDRKNCASRGCYRSYDSWDMKKRLLTVEDIMDDADNPKVYDMFKEKSFEKRYEILKKVWLIEERLEEKKRREAEEKLLKMQAERLLQAERQKLLEEERRLKRTRQRLQAEQKLLETKKKEQMLLECGDDDLVERVKNLPHKSKVNPRGKDFVLIQQLALAGSLYKVAKEESADVVNAWVPLFERIVSEKESKQLIRLQNRLNKKGKREKS